MRAWLLALAATGLWGCQTASADPGMARVAPGVASATQQVASIRIHVEGMACEKCSGRLGEGLRKLDGVLEVQASHQKKEVFVRYDAGRVSPDRIKEEIRRLGFETT